MWKKWLAFSGMLVVVIMLDPTHTPAQPGGKGGGREFGKGGGGVPGGAIPGGGVPTPGAIPSGGGRGFGGGGMGGGGMGGGRAPDPERSWAFLQQSTKSSGDTLDLTKMDQRTRDWLKGDTERKGGIPLPDGVVMTKGQFLDHFARSEAAKASFAANGGGMGAPGGGIGTPGGFGGPGGGMGTPGGGFGGGMGGGRDQNPEERAIGRMREQDRDRDGKVSFDEADRRLKENWKAIDANNDGYVDLDEYKGYYAAQQQGGRPGGPGGFDPNNPNGGSGPGGYGQPFERKDTEEERPVAMRYGKLPKDLPEWFDKLDDDKDGQVGLYEWRQASKHMKEFTEMDLNADGLVTADEYLRFARQTNINTKIATYEETGSRPTSWGIGAVVPGPGDTGKGKGGGFGGGMFGNKSDSGKSEERKTESKGDTNKGDTSKGGDPSKKGENKWRK